MKENSHRALADRATAHVLSLVSVPVFIYGMRLALIYEFVKRQPHTGVVRSLL